mgnify:CR=1 FL=1
MQTHSKYKFINWLRRRNQQRKRTLLLTGLILTLLFLAKMSVAQERPQDRSLSAEQIMAIVKKFHPIARIAGIMASKRCSELIPLCHPIALSHASVEFQLQETGVSVLATCATTGPTGVEMEALTACSASLLTIYDMCKAIDKSMEISGIRLLEKTGGSSSAAA